MKQDRNAYSSPRTIAFIAAMLAAASAAAQVVAPDTLPMGGQVVAGQAQILQNAGRMDIRQDTQKAILNWSSFNIGAQAQVVFNQPGSSAIALNRVISSDPSGIFGKLNANGQVFLINPTGVVFGPGSSVNVGGLVASTLNIKDGEFLNGNYRFTRDGALGSLDNQGGLVAADQGYIALLAPKVSNGGVIAARFGTVALAAGDAVTLGLQGAGLARLLSLRVEPATVNALVENHQAIRTEGGNILLSARAVDGLVGQVINNGGVVEASTIFQDGKNIQLEGGSGFVVFPAPPSVVTVGTVGQTVLNSVNQTISSVTASATQSLAGVANAALPQVKPPLPGGMTAPLIPLMPQVKPVLTIAMPGAGPLPPGGGAPMPGIAVSGMPGGAPLPGVQPGGLPQASLPPPGAPQGPAPLAGGPSSEMPLNPIPGGAPLVDMAPALGPNPLPGGAPLQLAPAGGLAPVAAATPVASPKLTAVAGGQLGEAVQPVGFVANPAPGIAAIPAGQLANSPSAPGVTPGIVAQPGNNSLQGNVPQQQLQAGSAPNQAVVQDGQNLPVLPVKVAQAPVQKNTPDKPQDGKNASGEGNPQPIQGKAQNKPESQQEAKSDGAPGKGEKPEKSDKTGVGRAESAAGSGRFARLIAADALRHQMRTELYKDALSILKQNPAAADIPACGAGAGVLCVPAPADLVKADQAATVAQDAVSRVAAQAGLLPATPIQRKVAYLIGNNDYKGAIPALDTPIADVEAIADQLKQKLGYEVNVVRNASRSDIILTLKKAADSATRDESVLIMYAGHGYQVDSTRQGYWIPTDASNKSPERWVSNNDITKFMSAIPAKQVILISDSCFSGSLTKERKMVATAGDRGDILARRTVLVMSSGGEEPVSDEGKEGHSIFAYTLINQLKKVSDFSTGSQVFENVRAEVSQEFPQQPQLGVVTSAGHTMGGDYLFEINRYIRSGLK